MPIFSKDSLETLRQRIDLIEVLSSHIDLKRSGTSYKTNCPFHDEKTPSFMIQKGDSHYHCFGCGAHGDAIKFMMAYLKMNFSDAVENLAQRFHVHLEKVEGNDQDKGPSKAALKEALEHACRFYHFILLHTPEGHEVLHYLYRRGLDLEFIRHFQIGLAPKAPGMFRKFMHAKFIKDEIMEAAGLLAPSKEGGWRDFFSDRITFPIRDATGSVIGFSARKYKEETFGGKYVNTPETPIFKKSRILFGLNYSRRRIAKERKAIIVEGQIDALRLIQAGFNFTVAGQGTAFGEGHVKELLNLGVREVYLSLDGDEAGQEAASKIGDFFQKEGVEVRVVQLPQGEDPDAYLKNRGPLKFKELLEKSIDYLTFLVGHHSRRINMESPASKNQLIQIIAKQVRSWDHPLMVHESLRKLAHLTQVSEQLIGMSQDYTPNLYIKKTASIGELQTIDPDRILETDFLRWLFLPEMQAEFLKLAKTHLKVEDLHAPACRKLYQIFLEADKGQMGCDLASIANDLDVPDGDLVIADILHKKTNRERAEQHFLEAIQKILERNWMEKREEIKMKIQSGQCSDEEALALVKQFDELKRNPPRI